MMAVSGLVLGASSAGAASISQGGFTQSFDVTVPKITPPKAKADGPYQFKLAWTTKSAGAAVAPPVTDVEIMLPAGVELRKQFQSGGTVCSTTRLAARNPSSCASSQVGSGNVQLDFQPFTSQTVPANVYVFLGPGGNGAVGSLIIMAIPDSSNAFVAANPVVANTKPVITAPIYRDSSSGFGLRMEMPIDIDAPVVVSIRSFEITMIGTKQQLKSSKGKKYFWASQPKCKKAAKFQATFKYVGASDATISTSVPTDKFKCPKKAKKKKRKKKK